MFSFFSFSFAYVLSFFSHFLPLVSFLSDTLVTLDTNGILRNLLCSVGWKWTPVLDLNQAKRTADHRLWPVTVKGNKKKEMNTHFYEIRLSYDINERSEERRVGKEC